MRPPRAVVPLLFLLTSCGGGTDVDEQALEGEAFYLERIATPPGSMLEVALVDLNLSDPARALVATTTTAVDNPPFPFRLSYDPADLQPDREYGLVVRLRDADGRQLFAADLATPPPVQRDSLYRIRLLHTPEGTPADHLLGGRELHWQCGDQRITTRYDGLALTLLLPDREVRLAPAVSASGARFGDDRSEFWSRGASEARLTLEGGEPIECAGADGPSPWEEARARGVTFRALGTEPGWTAEVDRGGTPAMRLVLAYGERRLTLARTTPLAGGAGFRGEAEGIVAELRIIRESCSDGMSDAEYPASVVLTVGADTFRGCGRFLRE